MAKTELVTQTQLDELNERARARKGNGPVVLSTMSAKEKRGFKMDLSRIRSRGLYGF